MVRRFRTTLALVFALVAACAAVGVAAAAPGAKEVPPSLKASAKLRQAVDPNGILVHERRFQRIANANGNTRASGTPGYDASWITWRAGSGPPATR